MATETQPSSEATPVRNPRPPVAQAVIDAMADYDYIELYSFDVDSTPRGRLIEKKRFQRVLQNKGLGIHAALCFYTNKGKPLKHPCFGTKESAGNFILCPDLTTLSKSQKAAVGDFKVGQVIGDLINVSVDGKQEYEETCPRSVARKQVEKLDDEGRGYTIRYNFEMELTLLDPQTKSPVDKDTSWGDMIKLMKYEAMMLELLNALPDTGVSCATLHCEAGPSQFEFVLTYDQDLKGADMAARFKKEASFFFEKNGLHASFVSYHEDIGIDFPRTLHLNHYLRSSDDEHNVFNDGPAGISNIARQWAAGIHKHLPALMALYCPTVNCYKRFTAELRQSLCFYAKHQRSSCLRRKKDGQDVYLENRLPSSAANPYLVLAGTIAAGRHGIADKMELKDDKKVEFPNSLSGALDKLEGDTYLRQELGEDFVGAFIAKKKEDFDIQVEH